MSRLRICLVILATTATTLLTGCGGSGPAPTPPTSAGDAAAATAGPTTPAAPAKKALPTDGRCVLINVEQATTLLGSTPKASSSNVTSDDEFTRVDGCAYTGTTANVGYDINEFRTGDPKTFVQAATTAMASAPGAEKFDVPGGDLALGFTMKLGARTMARIEVAKEKYTIGVNAVADDPAKAKQIALAATAALIAAV